MYVHDERVMPTGTCWCGCEQAVPDGAYFRPGHDRVAESAVIELHYGNVVGFLAAHGFGPSGENPRQSLESRRAHVANPRYRVIGELHIADGSASQVRPKHRFLPGSVSASVDGVPSPLREDANGDTVELKVTPMAKARVTLDYSHTDFERRR